MSAPSLNVPPDLRLARAWLNTAAGPRRGPNRRALTRAGALVVADTVPAVVFALGLAWALAAWTGGARPARGSARVVFWGAFAMALTWAAGQLFGAVV